MHKQLAMAVLILSAACAPPRQLGQYRVTDPGGVAARLAVVCEWGMKTCTAPEPSDAAPVDSR